MEDTTAMKQLIPIINKLQDVFNTIDTDPLDLPQIVVVGSQSSGKSSVLENIVGRDFLPRGSGIVTRRPLILQLIYLPWSDESTTPSSPGSKGSDEGGAQQEWGEFLHKPNEMFYNFNEIRDEIVKETDRLTGKNKGISAQPINLKIYSPHVVNLTLVDLPGITKVPVGDQPSDIELQIRRMINTYIQKPNTIILAVTPANTDLANSDALQLARAVDPEGVRTIGVITKIDLMDKGTDAMDVLTGKVIPLNLGFVGVINRSQEDIQTKKPIREALKSESSFFKNHPLYRTIASRCGTSFLAKTLNKILMHHIRDCLPDLKNRVNKLLADAQGELMSFGDPLLDTKNSQGALLLRIITQFSTDFKDAIDGKLTELSVNELYGGARINYIFNEIFAQCLNDMDCFDGLTTNDIRTTIRNATGPRAALFIPEVSFELLVKRQISRLEQPSLQCLDMVYDELQRIIAQLESQELARFANLRDRVIEVVHGLMQRNRFPTRSMIENLIQMELSFINTNHPDFAGGDGAISNILEKMVQQKQEQQQQNQTGSNPFSGTVSASSSGGVGGGGGRGVVGTTTATTTSGVSSHSKYPGKPVPAPPSSSSSSSSQPSSSAGSVPILEPGNAPSSHHHHNQQQQQGGGFLNMFFGPRGGNTQYQQDSSSMTNSSSSSYVNNPSSSSQYQSSMMSNRGGGGATDMMMGYGGSGGNRGDSRPDRLQPIPSTIKAGPDVNDRERFETELIRNLLASYFNVVRKNVKDMVPKSIIYFLVTACKKSIHNELVTNLYKEELFDELLEESPTISARRKSCKAMIEILRKAHDIINEVRDFSVVK